MLLERAVGLGLALSAMCSLAAGGAGRGMGAAGARMPWATIVQPRTDSVSRQRVPEGGAGRRPWGMRAARTASELGTLVRDVRGGASAEVEGLEQPM
jgi:hypothetical protein